MRLVAVLANPALAGHGDRTRARVDLAAFLLGCSDVTIVNLFPVASRSSSDIAVLGKQEGPWLSARDSLREHLSGADEVLLAYGLSSPSGEARVHFQAQIAWVQHVVASLGADPWMVGGVPRHPSRWQRHTSRTRPELSFREALRHALSRASIVL